MSSILARIGSINRCGKVLAFLVASFFVINFSNVAYAETMTNGVITDANDIRWEYELDTDEPRLTIRFYDKPSDATRVVVPSLGELTNLVPGAPSTLDTYYLRSADTAAQDSAFAELTRRESVDTTVLDMTNTSKIQILGVKPIINPEVETELVFGENMVIGDEEGKIIKAYICKGSDMKYIERNDRYYCWSNTRETYHRIPNYDIMTNEEREAYSATPESIGCVDKGDVMSSEWDPDKCYTESYRVSVIDEIRDNSSSYSAPYSYAVREGGAFSGYKLKLTNFNANNFNYVGWYSFEGSTFNDANTTMTIDGDAFVGSNIFQNTNIQKAIIKTENIGEGIFRDCINLTEVEFDSSVTKTTNAAFAGSGLTSFDFSSTNIKKISPNTFSGANQLSSVNLTGIERIEYMAFADTGIEELYLPKSIKWLGAFLFKYTSTLKRVTVAYDTLTSGTILQFNTVLDGTFDKDINQPSTTIEELTVLAPYAADEEVSDTHVSYEQYKWHYDVKTQEYTEEIATHAAANDCWGMMGAGTAYNSRSGGSGGGNCYVHGSGNRFWNNSNSRGNPSDFETDYANVDSKKNIIAPLYFYNLHGLKKITIGDGYEFVGSSAFYRTQNSYSQGWGSIIGQNPDTYSSYVRSIDEINLPDSLRGVGNLAFEDIWNPDIKLTIPRDIEFIGMGAFRAVYNWSGDVDFPNLVALGDFAFDSTMVHNIVLHDKLQYMGVQVFSKCPNINDVTFDFDVFNPDLWISWARPGRSAQNEADHFLFQYSFGEQLPGAFSRANLAKWGFRAAENDRINGYYNQQFGTITFTEKSVTDVPTGWRIDGMSSSYNNFFGHLNFDKVDLGKTGWKVLPQRAFVQAKVGEIILPEHLEVIPGDSFSDTSIKEELVLPDSVRVIGDAAFNYGWKNGFGGQVLNIPDREYDWHKDPVKITKLPASLEYVGNDAFWGDYYLEADLNSPNLKSVNFRAFMGTRLRDVYLPPTMKVLRGSAFTVIPTLRNITIDFDLGALPPNYYEFNPNDFPQSFRDYAGADSNLFKILTMSTSAYNMASQTFNFKYHNNCLYTFYNLFNQNYKGQYIETGNHYGKVVFTENARTSIYMTNDPGYFSQLEYDEMDLGEAGWNTITNEIPWGFRGAKIGKLTLPRGLETMTQGAFERAEITDSFTIPKSVKKMKMNAFMDAKLGGDVIFEDGPDDLTFEYDYNDTFLRATIDGTVSIPGRVKNLSGQNFMEAKLGGLELAEGVETIGKNVFLRAEIGDKVVIPSSMREIGENGFMEAKMDGLELKNGIEKFGYCSFIRAEIGGSFSFPGTVKEIGASAFMYAKMHTTGSFKEGLKTVGAGAFIHTNFADELVIPSSVESIGWSAFNAGDADVHYNTVVIKPNLTIASASNQRVHQLLWNASVDELTIDSSMLVAIDQGVEGPVSATDGGEEFWNMDIKKVTLNNLPKITYAAFNKCDKLEEVDMSRNANIRDIDDRAFAGDAKLHIIKFSPNIKNEDVRVGQYAFEGTAFTSIGDSSKDIDITAAKFYGTDGYAFAEMPKVETVDVPATFSYATIPEATFYNDPELREATVAYETTLMGNAAFANDNKLERIFIWGNTVVLDENLPGYEAPVGGMGADGDDVDGTDGDTTDEEEVGPTIPVGTDIYAYSVSPTEAYAGYDGRDDFEGVFYPLDEVLYITSNKPYVKLSDDGNDFDKSQLTVYALRRDGLVLESNDWSTWDGVVYSRNSANLTFEHMPEVMADNPAFGTVWDTPVPINLLDFGNENFAEIDFTLEKDPSMEEGVRKVNIVYTDKYTRGVPDTDIIPYTLPETPFTYAVNILCYVALLTGCAFVFRWATKGMRRGK